MSKKEIVITLAIALAMVPIRVVLATPGLSTWMAERNLGGMQTLLQGSYQISGDFGASVAQAAALLDPGFRAYDRLGDLYPLIGVTWDLDHVQMHPPVEIPLFLPFALISHETSVYKALAYFLPIALLVCLAWSLRLMNVPPPSCLDNLCHFCCIDNGAVRTSKHLPHRGSMFRHHVAVARQSVDFRNLTGDSWCRPGSGMAGSDLLCPDAATKDAPRCNSDLNCTTRHCADL